MVSVRLRGLPNPRASRGNPSRQNKNSAPPCDFGRGDTMSYCLRLGSWVQACLNKRHQWSNLHASSIIICYSFGEKYECKRLTNTRSIDMIQKTAKISKSVSKYKHTKLQSSMFFSILIFIPCILREITICIVGVSRVYCESQFAPIFSFFVFMFLLVLCTLWLT